MWREKGAALSNLMKNLSGEKYEVCHNSKEKTTHLKKSSHSTSKIVVKLGYALQKQFINYSLDFTILDPSFTY